MVRMTLDKLRRLLEAAENREKFGVSMQNATVIITEYLQNAINDLRRSRNEHQ